MAVHHRSRVILLLEYTRVSDTAPDRLWPAASRKHSKYQALIQALRGYTEAGWSIQVIPLVVGTRGSLLPHLWNHCFAQLGIPPHRHQALRQTAARLSVRSLHYLHLCRHKTARPAAQHTLHYKRRQWAAATWGQAAPLLPVRPP